jgi:hypothetical protein
VEGIPPDTPIFSLDYEGQKKRPPPDPACASLYTYLGTSYRGGPSAILIDRQINILTGRDVDRLRSDYAMDRVNID